MEAYYRNKLILDDIKIADTFTSRLKGLLGKKSISPGQGLLLTNCSSIHCFFMKFNIDALYLSKDMEVLHKETLKPWKLGKIVKNTRSILEIQEGASAGIEIGDVIHFVDKVRI